MLSPDPPWASAELRLGDPGAWPLGLGRGKAFQGLAEQGDLILHPQGAGREQDAQGDPLVPLAPEEEIAA